MKILIATDGSEFSRAAIEKCCQFVSLQNAEIKVISVAEVVTPIATDPFIATAEYMQEARAAIVRQTEESVEEAKALLRARFPDSNAEVTSEVIVGNPPRAIVEEAENWGADLIVCGSHGYGFWGRVVIGSVSQAVINHAPCSILVVRQPETRKVK